MLAKWFERKQEGRTPTPGKSVSPGLRVREPRRPVIDRAPDRPPLDADREFVYFER